MIHSSTRVCNLSIENKAFSKESCIMQRKLAFTSFATDFIAQKQKNKWRRKKKSTPTAALCVRAHLLIVVGKFRPTISSSRHAVIHGHRRRSRHRIETHIRRCDDDHIATARVFFNNFDLVLDLCNEEFPFESLPNSLKMPQCHMKLSTATSTSTAALSPPIRVIRSHSYVRST